MGFGPLGTASEELVNGKYKIIRRLAVGGMAEIFLAQATNIHGFSKKVVIKRILPQYANDASYVEMFLDEARLVARLNHPSIVQVFDIGQDAEGVFFTMEYIDGRDLSDVLGTCYKRKRMLSLEEVLAIAGPMAEALHHAHELKDDDNQLCNLVHRDVSPSNVIVTTEGRVKLLDFGVAKSRSQLRATTGVSLKGKFGYMAPEQCKGTELDRRSDIFSYGVVLWELFAGRRLYPGGNEPAVLTQIMSNDAPPPSSLRPDLPEELDAICLRALARNREERYSSLRELLSDLDDFTSSSGTVTTPRTLSNLIADVFPDTRPTNAIAAVDLKRLSLPLRAEVATVATPGRAARPSQPYALAPESSSSASASASGQHETLSNAPYGGGAQAYQSSGSTGGNYASPSYHTEAGPTRKPLALWAVGACLALAMGVGAALLASGDSKPATEAAAPATVDEVEEPSPAPVAQPAVPATSAAPAVAAEPADSAAATPTSKDSQSLGSASEPEVEASATTETKSSAETKSAHERKNKSSRERKGSRQRKPKKQDNWDPNSPFAPE